MGIRIFAFADDFFGGSHNFHGTELVADAVRTDLFKSGLWLMRKSQNGYPLKRTIIWVL